MLEDCPAEQAFGFKWAREVLPAFEKALQGKKVGEPFSFTIPCVNAYGGTSAELSTRFQRASLRLTESSIRRVQLGKAIP